MSRPSVPQTTSARERLGDAMYEPLSAIELVDPEVLVGDVGLGHVARSADHHGHLQRGLVEPGLGPEIDGRAAACLRERGDLD